MNTKQLLWIILALFAGVTVAMLAFRRVHRHGPVSNVPPSAWPRYLFGIGEYYDPYGIWPYGTNSNYQLFLSNSGVPVTSVPSPGSLTVGNLPQNPLYNGGTSGALLSGGGPGLGAGAGRGGGRG